MIHGSLFSGIGGFDLASEWMGWENAFHCEWNEFNQKVLKYYWPNAKSYADITQTDFTIWTGRIDILTGGFPCQPYSVAGKRKGKEDDRHLWPEMLRAIREIQPRWVVGENVPGLIGWNDGLVFDEVQTDLEAEGYEVQAYVLPAASVNAPHRRDRVWFVAKYSECKPDGRNRPQKSERNGVDLEGVELVQSRRKQGSNNSKPPSKNAAKPCQVRRNNGSDNREERHVQDNQDGNASKDKPTGNGRQRWSGEVGKVGDAANASGSRRTQNDKQQQRKEPKYACTGWQQFPTQSPICYGDDGLSERLDSITFYAWRRKSIEAGGNAIVPQVALQIFKAIEQFEIGGDGS